MADLGFEPWKLSLASLLLHPFDGGSSKFGMQLSLAGSAVLHRPALGPEMLRGVGRAEHMTGCGFPIFGFRGAEGPNSR